MACTTINAKILLRRDTAENWTANGTVVLQSGEPGFETDTKKLKIGDGVTSWDNLPYIGVADNNLIFTDIGNNTRRLTEYKENDTTYTVRSANLNDDMFNIVLASFTPILSGAILPANTLNWDVPCSGFSVSVTNPVDFPSQYISSVASATQLTGVFSALGLFTTTGPTPLPAGGVSWSQSFATNGTAVIQPISSTIVGGSASASIQFNVTQNAVVVPFNPPITLTATWRTPTVAISAASLSGNNFLNFYSTTTYSVSVTNITNSGNYVHDIDATGGTVSNELGNGTFTFTSPIYYYNTGTTRTVFTTTTFTRPVDVTGTSYTANLSATTPNVSASFTFPSFWLRTTRTDPIVVPDQSLIVSGNAFNTPFVAVLENDQKTLNISVTNNSGGTQLFWFGIRNSASQPSIFEVSTGGVYSPVEISSDSTQPLYPDSAPGDYVNVIYRLYGFNIQNNVTTFIRIT